MKTSNESRIKPLFTIITPVYNGEKYIRETIESVLTCAAGYSFEYIVVDDGSTDDTFKIVNEFASLIRIIRQDNAGEPNAVNAGLANSNGELILILSADDPLFTSELFSDAEEYFSSNSDVVAWYPNWRKIDHLGECIEEVQPLEFSLERVLGLGMCLPGPGTLFRAEPAKSIGGRSNSIKFASDYEFWLRLSQIGRISHRNKLVAQWREHGGSTSISSRGKAMGEERIQLVESFILSNSVGIELATLARASSRYFAAALGVFDQKVKSRKLMLASIRISKGLPKVAKLHVVVFALLHPLSFRMLKIASNLSRRIHKKINSL